MEQYKFKRIEKDVRQQQKQQRALESEVNTDLARLRRAHDDLVERVQELEGVVKRMRREYNRAVKALDALSRRER
jgi:hypothetical protein